MPWQGHLFIGQKVRNYQEAAEIFKSLGVEIEAFDNDEDAWEVFDGISLKKEVEYQGVNYPIEIDFMHESEGGYDFPVANDEDYTDAAVAFHLTQRYSGAILDHEHQHGGRPEPFEFDPIELDVILREVRTWWPNAKLMIWTVFY